MSTKPSIQGFQALGPKSSSIFDLDQARCAHGKPFHAGTSTTSFAYEPTHDDMMRVNNRRAVFEPTYRLGPRKKFKPNVVQTIIKSVLNEHLLDKAYDPESAVDLAKIITTEVQTKVKRQRFDRHKFVVNVTIGQKCGQSVNIASRCVWDKEKDSFATASLETSTLYAVGTVYGIYFE